MLFFSLFLPGGAILYMCEFGWCRGLQPPQELPEFQLSLRPDDYELPEIDPSWSSEKCEIIGQPLKEHLEDEIESESD